MPAPRNWFGLAGLVAIWGSAFLLINIAVAELDPLAVTAVRLWIGLTVMAMAVRLMGKRFSVNPRHWPYFLAMAVMGNCLPFYLITWGQQFIDSGEAGILMALVPLQVVLLAHFFIPTERLNWMRGLGFSVGFVGVIILFDPTNLTGLLSDDAQAGRLSVFAGGICYAVATVLAQRQPTDDPYQAALGSVFVASLLMAVAVAVTGTSITLRAGPAALLSVLGLGVFATGGATLLYFYLARQSGAAFLSLTNYLVPCLAAAIGAWVAGETLARNTLVALVVILAGIAISQRSQPLGTSGT